jgi:hypothetical protein
LSDNWSYNNLEAQYLKISITKCRIVLLFFHIAQIAEIEVYGCGNTDKQSQLLDEENSVVESMVKEAIITKKKDGQTTINQYNRTPSTPGKPVITFHH